MDTAEGILHHIIVSRFYLIVLCFFWFGDVAWCQGTALRPYCSEPGYKVSAPPSFWPQSERTVRSSKSRTTPRAAPIQIPDPENATISEEYGAGSIVIINGERKLYFVEKKAKQFGIRSRSALRRMNGKVFNPSRPSARTRPGIVL